jgi:hypothetical protein
MGTDIEMYAEIFDGERWKPAEPMVENEDYDPEDDPSQPRLRPQGIYSVRNRALFAILTDATGPAFSEESYKPVAPHRGLPVDVSPEILNFERARHDDGLFGRGWLGLDELLTFDWKGQIIQKVAVVDPEVVPLFEDNPLGFPYRRWPEGKEISYSMMRVGGEIVRWRETYEQSAGSEFMEEVLPKLKSFGPSGFVRIVFWFNC